MIDKLDKKEIDQRVGAQIKAIRTQRGLKTADVAALLELTPTAVRLIERGERGISVSMLFKLALMLGVDIGCFFEGANDKPIVLKKGEKYNKLATYGLLLGAEEVDFLIETAEALIAYRKKVLEDTRP